MMTRRLLAVALTCALGGCVSAPDKTGEVGDPIQGRADSFFEPADMGTISLGDAVEAELSPEQRFHAFGFELAGEALVRLESRAAGRPTPDTVFYLYRAGEDGWGRYVARDDDGGEGTFSRIETTLGAGTYRLMVKGYDSDADFGPYLLETACAGAGCAPAPVPEPSTDCLFGNTYGDFLESPNFEQVASSDLRADTELSELTKAQILATFDVYGESIATPAEAFEHVDGGYINHTTLRDVFDGTEYTSLEFGAGDNGFGAILRGGTDEVVAAIQDSFLEGCSVFEPVGRWDVETVRTEPDPALAEAFSGRIFAMHLTSGFAPGKGLAVSAYDDLVDEAWEIVNGEDPCYAFPRGSETEVEDYWDPWYMKQWMAAGHVQTGWEDAPTEAQQAALSSWFDSHGTESFVGFQGELLTEACGGSGEGYFFLFHNKVTADVTILLIYRYTE